MPSEGNFWLTNAARACMNPANMCFRVTQALSQQPYRAAANSNHDGGYLFAYIPYFTETDFIAWYSNIMEKYLREWRQEALNRCQYDTAIFVADKLLALTGMVYTDV